MPASPEKYFLSQLKSHHCQLPPSEDFEHMQKVSRFKNFFLISEKSLQSYLRVKSLSAIFYEKRRQLRTTSVLVVHPFSEFQKLCHSVMFYVFFASILLFPFFSAFHGPFYAKRLLVKGHRLHSFYAILAVVLFLQLACLLHVFVSFVTGYFIPKKDEVVIHLSGIAKHYLFTFFFLDLISSLPIDAFLVFTRGIKAYSDLPQGQTVILSIIPLLKLFRLRTFCQYFRTVYGFFYSSYVAYNLVVVLLFYFLLAHWFACLFMLIPRWLHSRTLFDHDNPIGNSLLDQYVHCIYICNSALISTAFDMRQGKIVAPREVLIFLIVLGKIYRTIIFIIFLQLLSTLMTGRLRYLEMMDQVAQYMRMKRFPRSLRKKVKINYIYLFGREYIGEKSIMQLLSDNLRREIVLRKHENLIQKVRLFSNLSENLIFEFVSCFKPEIYLQDDVVYKVGDIGECMYFISFGTVAVYSESKQEVGHLQDGDHFGEISLIFQLRRTFSVTALETTELYCLEGQDFLRVVKAYPAIFADMEKQAKQRYERTHDSGYTHEGRELNTKWTGAREGEGGETDPDSKRDSY